MIGIDFAGRRAIVTGGTSGIGLATARRLAEAGAHVAVTGTRPAADYGEDFGGLDVHRLDLGDDAALEAFAAGPEALDILVNCAGTVAYKGAEFEAETFRRVLDVNLTATMRLCALFRDRLARRPGAIVNVSSLTAFFASRGNPAYGASKAGVAQLTKSLAVAYARQGIRVNAIAPGWVKTRMTAVSHENEAIDRTILARSPFGRWGEAREMADAVVYLASDLASFVTGQTLLVDGGYSLAV